MSAPNIPEEVAAELLAFAISGRNDRIAEAHLATLPPEEQAKTKAMLAATHEALAALALAAEPIAPGAGLRERILRAAGTRKREAPRSALLVIDMINDHLMPGCTLEVPRARDVVPALKARIERARAEGIPVVYVVDEHDPADEDLDAWGAHAVKGSAGAEVWADLAPRSGDRIVRKPTYSGFVQSDLQEVLDDLAVETLVLTGCLTEIGVLATATDALQRGFAVEVPADSQAGSSAGAEQVALGVMQFMAPYGPARRARLEKLSATATLGG